MAARRAFHGGLLVSALLSTFACGGGTDDGGAAGPDRAAGPSRSSSAAPSPDAVGTASERVAPVRVREIGRESVAVDAEWPGELRSARRATLAIEVAGVVSARPVNEGQSVGRGAVLMRIDSRDLEQSLAEATALDRQRAAQLERADALLERRSITKAQWLDAYTQRDVAAARLAAAELALEKATLRAPWAGRVARVAAEVGDFVAPGETVLELIDIRLEMWAAAPAADAPHLSVGQAAEVTIDAFPGETFDARLVRLGAELDASSRTLDAVAALDETGRLRPGFTGRLRVELRRLEDALRVPLDAVVELGDGRAVYVVTGGGEEARAERRSVELGPVVGDRVVVTAGLEAGERVIVAGQRRVSPGQRVRPEDADG